MTRAKIPLPTPTLSLFCIDKTPEAPVPAAGRPALLIERRAEGLYTPPSRGGTLFHPFTGGGANWGGPAYDPRHNLLVINMTSLAHVISLLPNEDIEAARETYHDQQISPIRTPLDDKLIAFALPQ